MLAHRKGAQVFGIGSHLDAVRSTRLFRVLSFGHCWVVLSVLIRVPFSQRVWALPILLRLYRTRSECEKHSAVYRKKTQLGREMLDVLCEWTDWSTRRIELAADSAYCNDTVTRGLPNRVVLFGAMRPDAVLTELPKAQPKKKGGRPRKRGELLPKPEAIANDESQPWKTCQALLYGRIRNVHYKTLRAQCCRACGVGLLRIVIVRTTTGTVPLRVFFCTDATLGVRQVLQGYAERWAIEVFFREAKQLLGFAVAPVRKAQSVLRVAPFIGLLYTTLVLWFLDERVHLSPLATPPLRPWYSHKRGFSFADILRTARRALNAVEVLVPCSTSDNLPKPQLRTRTRTKARVLVHT